MKQVLLGVVLSLGVGVSFADTFVSSGYEDLTFTLVDLDQSDGMTPTLTALGHESCVPSTIDAASCLAYSVFVPVAPDYRPPSSSVHANSTTFFSSPPYHPFRFPFGELTFFELSGATRLIVSGTLFAASTGPSNTSRPDGDGFIDVSSTNGSAGSGVALSTGDTTTAGSLTSADRQPFTFIIDAQGGAFDFSLLLDGFTSVQSASAFVVPAPVPEPETYALMLVGLGALGGLVRRSNSRVGRIAT